MTCPAEGRFSLLALVPVGMVMDPPDGAAPDDPVLVHVTSCKAHLRAVRSWLRARTPDDPITCGTEALMRDWQQIVDPIQVPVFGMAAVAGG